MSVTVAISASGAPVMREHGVLFSAPMVRAILAGLKMQTRRLVKPQPTKAIDVGAAVAAFIDRRPHFDGRVVGTRDVTVHCPLGSPGERLWVREAWRAPGWCDNRPPRDIPMGTPVDYLADPPGGPKNVGKYRHARFMPRWMSRLTLEVTEVRVQRLHDISEENVIAEGIDRYDPSPGHASVIGAAPVFKPPGAADFLGGWSARAAYQRLWNEINGTGSWERNEWVWAVSFRKLEGSAA